MEVDKFAELSSSIHHITEEVLEFVKDFDGVELAYPRDRIGCESFGHRKSTVAAECAQLEDAMSIDHLAKHLEQSSLKVA